MRSPTLLALAFTVLVPSVWSVEPVPATPTEDAAVITPELLAERLPKVPGLVVQSGSLWWDDGMGARVRIAPVDIGDGNPLLETPIGRLPVDRALVATNRTEIVALVQTLVAAAQAAGLTSEGLTLREGALAGIHLRGDNAVVLPEGVLRKVEAEAMERAADLESVATAASSIMASLEGTRLDALGRSSVETVLHLLVAPEGKRDLDELTPAMARRLVREGWLDGVLPGIAGTSALVAAVRGAEAMRPVTLFEGPGLRLAEVKDAFGRGGWILTTPTRSAYLRPHPEPQYHWNFARMSLAVDLPAGSDPLGSMQQPVSARLWRGATRVLSWTRDGGLLPSDPEDAGWRDAVPAKGKRGVDPNAVTNFLPPHLAVASLNGDLAGLITRNGFLAAPAGALTKDRERFLREAAQQLTDPAHLDLIGEYLVTYVYDSPDSRFPTLVGTKQVKGDIHQTADQTVATAVGGICRGDCDDVAELYQNIAERQGRTAIVLSLPGHAALAWAEKQEDGNWHVFVLQTGPALEFVHAELPKALAAAYKSFDESDAFDPNGLGLLLRFSGENTRSSWRLSWRIFAEPDYARTMIDVQKDWHYQTYQRGIRTMQELIAKGDQDTANFRELSGLYAFTGQYALAAEHHRKALDATKEPESRLLMKIELAQHLYEAGSQADADLVVEDLLANDLPSLREDLGASLWQTGLQLTGTLTGHHRPALAVRALHETLLQAPSDKVPALAEQIEKLIGYLDSPKFNPSAWQDSQQLQQLKHVAGAYAGTVIALVNEVGPAGLERYPELHRAAGHAQRWLDRIAFTGVEDPSEGGARYATAAQFYAGLLGQDAFDRLVDATPVPTMVDERERAVGLAQLHADLPSIRVSVPYWWMRLTKLFDKEATTLDAAAVARTAARLEEAYQATRALGEDDVHLDNLRHLGQLVAALVARDPEALRLRLRHVVDKNDKRLRDDTAQWMGDVARFLPIDWYGQVIGIWQAELDYKPKWYWIAWRAALMGGRQQALLVAAKAAERYADDPSFVEEYDFMRRLYEGK